MALTPGARLGSYKILSALGVGGIGEVYRAHDTKLKRQVAIKILPASLSGDRDRHAPFQSDAEVLASLNHPHIAAIHGLEDADGNQGARDGTRRGRGSGAAVEARAIPLDEALPIAWQIAEALDAVLTTLRTT